MVAVHLVTTMAHKETAKQAILKQLREAGAATPQMPSSLDISSDEAQAALAELLAAGTVKQARAGSYYSAESKAKEARPGVGFVVVLVTLVAASFIASLVAIAATQG